MPGEGGSELSMSAESFALEHTPTWAVAAVCVVFIALSLLMQRGLQRLGTVSRILIFFLRSFYASLQIEGETNLP